MNVATITRADWIAEATRLFGANSLDWRFVCPVCKHVAAVKDWHEAGAPEGAVAFSCIGRWTGGRDAFKGKGPGPCNYTSGGLFQLAPVRVEHEGELHPVFDFDRAADTTSEPDSADGRDSVPVRVQGVDS